MSEPQRATLPQQQHQQPRHHEEEHHQQTIATNDTNTHNSNELQQTENLVCQWNGCLKDFPDHPSLATHLSNDHVGWKKEGYFCDWSNCSRQGTKCHNRFALIMHLRIHTGEKPFGCKTCGQSFGRQDALMRHEKAEHGEEPMGKPPTTKKSNSATANHSDVFISPHSNPVTAFSSNALSSFTFNPNLSGATNNKARKYVRKVPGTFTSTPALDMLKSKRHSATTKTKKALPGEWLSSGDESDHSTLDNVFGNGKAVHSSSSSTIVDKLSIAKPTQQQTNTSSPDYIQYRLARAQLHYILRENEMLQDEYNLAQKKLKRMKTERRVLLDAVMNLEQQHKVQGGERAVEVEEDDLDIDDEVSDNEYSNIGVVPIEQQAV